MLLDISLDKDFEAVLKEFSEDVLAVHGFVPRYLDPCIFSERFFSPGPVADKTINDNSNVTSKTIVQWRAELSEAHQKLAGFNLLFKKIKELYSTEDAKTCFRLLLSGDIFLSDSTLIYFPYCYAFDLRKFIMEGMPFAIKSVCIKPPKRADSYINGLYNITSFLSNHLAGAVAFPDALVILDWLYRKEFGKDYIKRFETDSAFHYKLTNQWQSLIYGLNMPFKSAQAAFSNLSIFDRIFLEGLFKNYFFPDGTTVNIDTVYELQKHFYKYFVSINMKEGIFTFPVITIAISVIDGQFGDPDFVKWAAEANASKSIANVYLGEPSAFSTCCRMVNDYSKINSIGYVNSFGASSGLNIGSTRVCGINFARLGYQVKGLKYEEIQSRLDYLLDHIRMILLSHRAILKDHIDKGYLPLYTHHWMSLKTQYNTVGFVGMYEFYKYMDQDLHQDMLSGQQIGLRLLQHVNDVIQKWGKQDNELFNIEQIPAESMAVRLWKLDRLAGIPQLDQVPLYSNQYIPLWSDTSIYDRFRIQGLYDKYTGGGAILHINIEGENVLTDKQYYKFIDIARQTDTRYFAINYPYAECEQGHFSIGKSDKCPICGKDIVEFYTRVVGYIVPVSSWNYVRREKDFPNRFFFKEM